MPFDKAFEKVNTPKTVTEEDVAFDECYNTNCKYVSKTGGEKQKCTFETCIYKEWPKHPRSYKYQCFICNTEFECNIEDIRMPICPECVVALRHVVIGHRNGCIECVPIEHESDIDQFLPDGEDGSNEDWNH